MARFTHLHVHSHYSLLDGLARIPELVSRAKALNMKALALTDHGVMYGAVEFYTAAKEQGLKPIIGLEAYVAENDFRAKGSPQDKHRSHLVLLAKNNVGYHNLLQLTTKAHLEGFYYKPRIDKPLLLKHAEGLIGTTSCLSSEICKAIRHHHYDAAEALLIEYLHIFEAGDFYIELQRHLNTPIQQEVNAVLLELAAKYHLPIIATNDVHYLRSEDAEAQDILMAIQMKKDLTDEKRLSMRHDDFSMFSTERMAELFRDTPEALEMTGEIVDKCNVELEIGTLHLPYFEVPKGETNAGFLERLCYEGVTRRYGFPVKDGDKGWRIDVAHAADQTRAAAVDERVRYELSVIEKTGYLDYFLIVQDLVNWAKSQGIVVGPGRGSAAGSIAAYLLNITNMDPLAYDLLFERFLNPARVSMPDIDLDFADKRRDEVIEYARSKYGTDHVAQIITFGTMAARAAIRDVGRVMGYEYIYCDRLAKLVPFGLDLKRALAASPELKELYATDPKTTRLIDIAQKLEGVARHASTHACGVVITKEALDNYTPRQFAPTDEKTIVTQYEMHAVEKLGLLKMDFLGLKNLTIIEDALRIIKKVHGVSINLDTLPLDDAVTFNLLKNGNTTGIFQLESDGMRRYLKQLSPTEFEDIIAMVSLYRPGPMELIPTYIARKHGKEQVTYLHPKLEPILKKTYGIMVYQEQLLQAAQALAGVSLAEADILRKAVGKKIKKLLQEQKTKLLAGMKKNKIPAKTAEAFWKLIEPFSRYGFVRSHGACYAMIAYQTAYLKAHYPTEFMTALLNSRESDVEEIAFLIEDARLLKITVLPPDINESLAKFTATGPTTIRFGLEAVKNVGEKIVADIIAERKARGPFANINDFISRVRTKDLNRKSLESLIKAGACDSLGERGGLLKNLDRILKAAQELKSEAAPQVSLFSNESGAQHSFTLKLEPAPPASTDERLAWEKELLGLYISDNPIRKHLAFLAKHATPITTVLTAPEAKVVNRTLRIGGQIEDVRRITTKRGEPMLFLKIRDQTGALETVVFPKVLAKYPDAWSKGGVVIMEGQCQKRNGDYNFVCEKVKALK